MKGKPRTSANFDWGVLLPEVALQLMGEPKTMGSQEWRYGSEGAGSWYCFETGTSGVVVALIEREAGLSPENKNATAIKWLRDRGLIPAETPTKPQAAADPDPPPPEAAPEVVATEPQSHRGRAITPRPAKPNHHAIPATLILSATRAACTRVANAHCGQEKY